MNLNGIMGPLGNKLVEVEWLPVPTSPLSNSTFSGFKQ